MNHPSPRINVIAITFFDMDNILWSIAFLILEALSRITPPRALKYHHMTLWQAVYYRQYRYLKIQNCHIFIGNGMYSIFIIIITPIGTEIKIKDSHYVLQICDCFRIRAVLSRSRYYFLWLYHIPRSELNEIPK